MYSKTLILCGFGIVIYNLFYSRADKQNQLVNDLKWGIGTQALIGILGLTGIAIFSDIALGTNMSLFYLNLEAQSKNIVCITLLPLPFSN
ncbi:Uncharacterised protein [Actinobacillus equuli]|nr:Uncharacterised protein [Actinobacillus equuli]